MKKITMLTSAACFFLGSVGLALAGDEPLGKAEFDENCASCHGVTGKGDGPFTEFLKHGVPTLTTLSKNNGGVFPVDRVYKAIDGKAAVKAHGPREMPIWGQAYYAEAVRKHGPFFGDWYSQDIINARILSLISHIESLQEK